MRKGCATLMQPIRCPKTPPLLSILKLYYYNHITTPRNSPSHSQSPPNLLPTFPFPLRSTINTKQSTSPHFPRYVFPLFEGVGGVPYHRFPILTAVTAPSTPLFPRRPPARSNACCLSSVVSTLNITGQSPLALSIAVPCVTDWHT